MNKKHILKIDNRDEVNGKKSVLNLQNFRKIYSKEGVDFLLSNLSITGSTNISAMTLSGADLIFTDNAGGNTTIPLPIPTKPTFAKPSIAFIVISTCAFKTIGTASDIFRLYVKSLKK